MICICIMYVCRQVSMYVIYMNVYICMHIYVLESMCILVSVSLYCKVLYANFFKYALYKYTILLLFHKLDALD